MACTLILVQQHFQIYTAHFIAFREKALIHLHFFKAHHYKSYFDEQFSSKDVDHLELALKISATYCTWWRASKCLKTSRKIFRTFFWQNMSLQNEINLWFLLGSKFTYFASQVNFISSFIERFNAKGCLGVASLPPIHRSVAKFWLIAINTAFQVCFLKTSWNGFMKSLCSFSDWTFVFFFLSIVVFRRLWLC